MSESKKGIIEEPEYYGKERKIFRLGGRSKVVTLPPSFWTILKEQEVRVFQIGKILVLVPAESWEQKVGELDFQNFKQDDPHFLEYQIISAYLNNYREIDITFEKPCKECIDCLERLPRKLLGLSPSFGGDLNRREVYMSTSLVKPIPEILKKMHSSIQTIYKFNQNIFSKLEVATEVELANIEALENDIDKQSFLIKRLFCVVLTQLYLADRVGISDLTQIVHYESLNSNLERAGDLQLEICKELNRLLKKFGRDEFKKMIQSKNPTYSFQEYHKAAQKMLDDAYSNELGKIVEIIKTKKQDLGPEASRDRGKYIAKEQMKAITDLTVANSDLRCLDFRIWGVTGSATNVAEAWLNMRGPFIKRQDDSREVTQSPANPARGAHKPLGKRNGA